MFRLKAPLLLLGFSSNGYTPDPINATVYRYNNTYYDAGTGASFDFNTNTVTQGQEPNYTALYFYMNNTTSYYYIPLWGRHNNKKQPQHSIYSLQPNGVEYNDGGIFNMFSQMVTSPAGYLQNLLLNGGPQPTFYGATAFRYVSNNNLQFYIPYGPYAFKTIAPINNIDTGSALYSMNSFMISNKYNTFGIDWLSDNVSSFFGYHNFKDNDLYEEFPLQAGYIYPQTSGFGTGLAFSRNVAGAASVAWYQPTRMAPNIFLPDINAVTQMSESFPLWGDRVAFFPGIGIIKLGHKASDVPFFESNVAYNFLEKIAVVWPIVLSNNTLFYPKIALSLDKKNNVGVGVAYDNGVSPYDYMTANPNIFNQTYIDNFITLYGELISKGGWAIETSNGFEEFYDIGEISYQTRSVNISYTQNVVSEYNGQAVNIFSRWVSEEGRFFCSAVSSPNNNNILYFMELGYSFSLPSFVRNFSRGFLA